MTTLSFRGTEGDYYPQLMAYDDFVCARYSTINLLSLSLISQQRRCGPRILTFFLYLSDVEEGGESMKVGGYLLLSR